MQRPARLGVIAGVSSAVLVGFWFILGVERVAVIVAVGVGIGAVTALVVGALEERRANRQRPEEGRARSITRAARPHSR